MTLRLRAGGAPAPPASFSLPAAVGVAESALRPRFLRSTLALT